METFSAEGGKRALDAMLTLITLLMPLSGSRNPGSVTAAGSFHPGPACNMVPQGSIIKVLIIRVKLVIKKK